MPIQPIQSKYPLPPQHDIPPVGREEDENEELEEQPTYAASLFGLRVFEAFEASLLNQELTDALTSSAFVAWQQVGTLPPHNIGWQVYGRTDPFGLNPLEKLLFVDLRLAGRKVAIDAHWIDESLTTKGIGLAFTAGKFESEYQNLSRTRERFRNQDARATFWVQFGHDGIAWLLNRIRSEVKVDVLDSVAAILRRAPKDSVPLIYAALLRAQSPEVKEALIHGLRRVNLADEAGSLYGDLRSLLFRMSREDEEDVRLAAYETIAKLRLGDAESLLRDAAVSEPDPQLRAELLLLQKELGAKDVG